MDFKNLTPQEQEVVRDTKDGVGYYGRCYKNATTDKERSTLLYCALEDYWTDSAPNVGCAPDELT